MKQIILILGIIFFLVVMSINPTIAVLNSNDDTTPPTTSYTLDPSTPNGENGWYTSVAIIIYAYDSESGVSYIKLSLNGGAWQTQPGDIAVFIIDSDGDFLVRYTAVDNAGNQAPIKNFTIDIDGTIPVVVLEYECIGPGSNDGWLMEFTATATDSASGIECVEFYLGNVLQESFNESGGTYKWSFEYHTYIKVNVTVKVYDIAGNKVFTTIDEIKNIRISNQQSSNLFLLRFLDHFPLLHRLLDTWRQVLL